MKHRKLGKTNLEVSEIGFGSWAIGGNSYGKTDDAESLRAIQAAVDGGVDFFDTADIYGNGHSEELLGKVLEGRREKVILASKVGWDFYHGGVRQNFSPEYIEFACHKTLERLRTDWLDLYQLHNPNLETLSKEELYQPLEKLKKEGKIRFYGLSIHVPQEGMAAIVLGRVDTLQLIYNLIDQRPAAELLPLALEKNIGVIAREPFNCGMLTGKYDKSVTFQGPDHRKRWKRDKIELDLEKLDRIRKILGPKPASVPVMALEFVLAHPAVSTVIPGVKTEAQMRENLQASEGGLLSYPEIEKITHLYQSDPVFQTGFYRN